MLNPFIQLPPDHKQRKPTPLTEESIAQLYGHSVDTASPRPSMGLWVGRLLIRMGQKLSKEDIRLKSSGEHA